MAEQKLPKLTTGVRFPSPAPDLSHLKRIHHCLIMTEPLGMREVMISLLTLPPKLAALILACF